MTQLRSRDTKAVRDLWTTLQDPEARRQRCRLRPMLGDIMVYPCPVLNPAHLVIATDRVSFPPDTRLLVSVTCRVNCLQ